MMELSREQIYFLAGLITSQISVEIDQKLEGFKKELSLLKATPSTAVKMIDRRKVAHKFGVTSDTITTYCRKGIFDKSLYIIINSRYKFFSDKIDNLILQQKEGLWEPNKRFVKAT